MKFFLFLVFIIPGMSHLSAQQKDSLFNNPFSDSKDSLSTLSKKDSLFQTNGEQDSTSYLTAADTSKKKTYDVDSVIYSSSSDSLIFYVNKKKMDIYGNGELKYKQTDLRSAEIFVDFNTNNIEAFGVPSDSIPNKFVGTPVLNEGGEEYTGKRMTYNFKTLRGFISSAGTKTGGAIYTGAKIKKIDKNDYFIKDGIYTTCENDTPHYYFYASEMKVVQKKEIVAKWIWLYFGGVPFPLPLPFAVFPIESGRRSGIIPPVFGQSASQGNYFSNFGYFWAINDYVDVNLQGSYWTRGSFELKSRFRYNKRYDYFGNLSGGYRFSRFGDIGDNDCSKQINWNLQWSHSQNIDPSLKFNANMQFTSGNYFKTTSTDLSQVLQNQIYSNATLLKTWEESGNSLSLSYSRKQDLQNGNIEEQLPNLTFNKSQSYPFKGEGVGKQKWYELFGYSYTGRFLNNRVKTGGNLKIRGGILHTITTSFSPKIGYFSITPNFQYQEKWYNKRIEKYAVKGYQGDDSTVVTKDIKEINFVRTFSTGLTASTRFFGIFQPNMFGISAVRHTVTPSISYSYRPDFSKPNWGYYDTYNFNGQQIKYDKYGQEVFGGASSGEQQSISFRVGNLFEMKTQADPTDTTSKEKKIQLLNLDASMGYNFAADSLKFSDLLLNFRTSIGDLLSFNGSSQFTPYDYSEATKSRINKFLINEGKGFLRMTNFQFSVSTSLSGEKLKSKEGENNTPEDSSEIMQNENRVYKGIYEEGKEADFSIPWNVSLTYNYTLNRPTPLEFTEFSTISGGFNFNLTPNWKFSFSGSYDFKQKEFAAPQIRISRDLHEWVMNFTWNPIGIARGYYFEIKIKAPQLQDLKVTKSSNFYSNR
jgi:lipopolysaccharide assembly outer membrane protein LptD (OstA)